jgi:hypothetical protein
MMFINEIFYWQSDSFRETKVYCTVLINVILMLMEWEGDKGDEVGIEKNIISEHHIVYL